MFGCLYAGVVFVVPSEIATRGFGHDKWPASSGAACLGAKIMSYDLLMYEHWNLSL